LSKLKLIAHGSLILSGGFEEATRFARQEGLICFAGAIEEVAPCRWSV
jgi:hypothetical protein